MEWSTTSTGTAEADGKLLGLTSGAKCYHHLVIIRFDVLSFNAR